MKKIILAIIIACTFFGIVHSGRHDEQWLRGRIVRLVSEHNMCTGEQVKAPSGQNYILTAGHCLVLAHDGSITVKLDDGTKLDRRVIAEDSKSDLLLLEGLPNVDGIRIAEDSHEDDKIFSLTHGANWDTYRTDGRIKSTHQVEIAAFLIESDADLAKCEGMSKFTIEEEESFFGTLHICCLKVEETFITASIQPGSSGGLIANEAGELVGVVSAGSATDWLMVQLTDVQAFIKGY